MRRIIFLTVAVIALCLVSRAQAAQLTSTNITGNLNVTGTTSTACLNLSGDSKCVWPAGGGGTGSTMWVDGGAFIYPNSTFADNVIVYGYIKAYDWTNLTNSQGNWNVNGSVNWANKNETNATQFNNGGTKTLTLNWTWLTGALNSLYISATNASIVTTTTIVGLVGNWSADKASYAAISNLVGMLGNWSADKGSYSTTAQANALYVSGTNASIANWSAPMEYIINGTLARSDNASVVNNGTATNIDCNPNNFMAGGGTCVDYSNFDKNESDDVYLNGSKTLTGNLNAGMYNFTGNSFIGNTSWQNISDGTFPDACPTGTWVSQNDNYNTCTAPVASDVDPGAFPSGNYNFSGNVVIDGNLNITGNLTIGGNLNISGFIAMLANQKLQWVNSSIFITYNSTSNNITISNQAG